MLSAQGPIIYAGMMGSRLDPTLMTISLTDNGRSRNTGGGAFSSVDDKNVGHDSFDADFSLKKWKMMAAHERTKTPWDLLLNCSIMTSR